VRGKPKPEQPQYNGAEDEADTEDNEHRAITKSRTGLNRRLDYAALFLVHSCVLVVPASSRRGAALLPQLAIIKLRVFFRLRLLLPALLLSALAGLLLLLAGLLLTAAALLTALLLATLALIGICHLISPLGEIPQP
jgi:hypothetical protein